MNKQAFDSFREAGFTHIPVFREILADLDTPLSTYLKLAAGPQTFLFESVQGGERWGRYSIIGLPARTTLRYHAGRMILNRNGQRENFAVAEPLSWLREFLKTYKVPELPQLPRFVGGLVGVFGYDLVRHLESRLATGAPPDELNLPELALLLAEDVVVFDNLSARLFVITLAPADDAGWTAAQQRLAAVIARLRGPLTRPAHDTRGNGTADFVSGFGQAAFEAAVRECKRYIRAGDAMQIVLSQRLSAPYTGSALDVYRALRCFNPSPYLYCLDFGDVQVAGASPEVLARVEDGTLTVRPIAGTRHRGRDSEEDAALECELLADEKERAEHLMLIDLGRNDAGRVSAVGSVQVTERMVIERYSHVMHMVSNVSGKLAAGRDAFDALRAIFPAGTLSGAPKIRAMQIIDECEPARRGWYGGAVGYIGWQGNMDTAIAIRTVLLKDGRLHVQAGAGIVHDSIPEREWQETLHKACAVFRAVQLTERGLDNVDFRLE